VQTSTIRLFALRYVFALLIILMLAVLSQFFIQTYIASQLDDATIINVAGRQRMLSQRLVKATLAIEAFPDRREFYLNQLVATVEEWEIAHTSLQNSNPELGIYSNNSDTVIDLFSQIEQQFNQMLTGAFCILDLNDITIDSRIPPDDCSQVFDSYINMIVSNEERFLVGMNAIVNQYEVEARDGVVTLRSIELMLFGFLSFTLLVEALFIFRPVIRQAQSANAEAEKRRIYHQSLFEQSNDAVLVLDLQGHHLDINSRGVELFGYTKDEILITPHPQLTPKNKREHSQQILEQLIAGENIPPYEHILQHKDGYMIDVEISSQLVRDEISENSLYIQSIIRDIRQRKQADQQIRESEAMLRQIIDTSQDHIWLIRLSDQKVLFNNKRVYNFYGRSAEEMGDADNPIWREAVHHSSPNSIAMLQKHLEDHGKAELEFVLEQAQGTLLNVMVRAWFIFDDNNMPIQVAGITQDISKQKQYQQMQVDIEGIRARYTKEHENNQFVQKLVAMLSHDLRTPLSVIQSNRDILSRHLDELTSEKRKEKLDTISSQIAYATGLLEYTVESIQDIQSHRFNPTSVNIEQLCKVSITQIQETNGKHQ